MTTTTTRVVSAPSAIPAERSGRRSGTPERGRAHPTAVLATIGVGAAAVVMLWWQNTPSLSGLGDWLTNAGRVTGLLAGYGMVVLVALMARIPPLERGVGADRLARWHAMGGRYSVSLVVVHGLLITWGYAVSAHTDPLHQGWTLLMSYPDVLMATVAGLLLVGVGITSARAARKRLAYETWYFLHLYTYLAVVLAFSHQFADGAEFVDNRAARAAWSLLYGSVGAAILWYRVATPVVQAFRHRLRVESVRIDAPGVVTVTVRGRNLLALGAEPGQFFRWRFLNRDLWWVSTPYSLSAPPTDERLRITVKALGDHSAQLVHLRPGTRVVTEGPYGALTAALRRRPKVLLVAGGVGITPLRALFETIPARPGHLTLLYRTSRAHDVVFRQELTELAEQRGARLWIVSGSRAELGGDPLNARTLLQNLPDVADHDIYLCGPPGMTAAASAALREAGVPRRHLHKESFSF